MRGGHGAHFLHALSDGRLDELDAFLGHLERRVALRLVLDARPLERRRVVLLELCQDPVALVPVPELKVVQGRVGVVLEARDPLVLDVRRERLREEPEHLIGGDERVRAQERHLEEALGHLCRLLPGIWLLALPLRGKRRAHLVDDARRVLALLVRGLGRLARKLLRERGHRTGNAGVRTEGGGEGARARACVCGTRDTETEALQTQVHAPCSLWRSRGRARFPTPRWGARVRRLTCACCARPSSERSRTTRPRPRRCRPSLTTS